MNDHDRIVVWDPKGEYWEGALISRALEAPLNARGVVTMPCDETLFKRGGNCGFVKRAWGAGYPMSGASPSFIAPLTMLIFRETKIVHWRARVMSTHEFDLRAASPYRPTGVIRFVGNGREHAEHAHISQNSNPVDIGQLGPKDPAGGWTLGGRVSIMPHLDGHYSFSIYGAGEGLRVVWLAASAVKE